jgi:TolB-like protein/Tfp pilus assembly protein PilF
MSAKPSFFAELQRRNVYKVGAMYAVAGWLVVQVVTQVFPIFHVSELVQRLIVLGIVAGFPLALVLSWIYELTPQGIVKTDAVAPGASVTGQTGQKLNRAIIGALSLAVLVLLGKILWPQALGTAAPATTAAPAADKSIAVLPFDNLSDDKANAYFAEGIQDEILTRLAGINQLKVISRTSTEKYKSHPDNLRTVAAELGVSSILEGSVQKAGDSARINVQLIDAATDHHLWARTYDRALKDVFAVESEVSQDIAEALQARLSPGESGTLAAVPTRNAQAYDWFLKGEYAFHHSAETEAEEDFRRAEEDYRQAIALDPDFALAHARLSYALMQRHWFLRRLSPDELAQAKASAERAVALAPDMPDGHAALGHYWYWGLRDYDKSMPEYRRALELAPSNIDALNGMASVQRRQGRWSEALQSFARAAALAPQDSGVVGALGETHQLMRHYAQAEPILARAVAIAPEAAEPTNELLLIHLFGHGDVEGARQLLHSDAATHWVLYNYAGGNVNVLVGPWVYPDLFERKFDDALRRWDAAPRDTPKQRHERLAARAVIMTLAGRQAEISDDCAQLKTAMDAEAQARPDDPSMLEALAWANLCLGQNDAALAAARRATELLPLEKDAYFGGQMLTALAEIETRTGHLDQAFPLLTRLLAIPTGDCLSVERIKHDPLFDPLRADPRYARLITDGEAAQRAQEQQA